MSKKNSLFIQKNNFYKKNWIHSAINIFPIQKKPNSLQKSLFFIQNSTKFKQARVNTEKNSNIALQIYHFLTISVKFDQFRTKTHQYHSNYAQILDVHTFLYPQLSWLGKIECCCFFSLRRSLGVCVSLLGILYKKSLEIHQFACNLLVQNGNTPLNLILFRILPQNPHCFDNFFSFHSLLRCTYSNLNCVFFALELNFVCVFFSLFFLLSFFFSIILRFTCKNFPMNLFHNNFFFCSNFFKNAHTIFLALIFLELTQ